MNDMWARGSIKYDERRTAWTFLSGIPTTINQYARPLYDKEHLNAALGIYGQDRWTINV
jgi:hypothetical protein